MICPRCKQTELIFDECEYFCPPPCGAVFTATEIELERCRAEMAFLRKEDSEYGEALLSARSEIERLRTALERDRARVEALKEWCKMLDEACGAQTDILTPLLSAGRINRDECEKMMRVFAEVQQAESRAKEVGAL